MKIIGILVLLGLAGFASNARAWNDRGHLVIAAIAWSEMTPQARAGVSRLLRLNPEYPSWVEGLSQDRDEVAFLRAATWPDALKREAGYENDGGAPVGPGASLNLGYADRRQHRYWHFVDMPFSTDGTPLPAVMTPNAATQIAVFRRTITSATASDELKSYDLTWLIHLVGDVHQPLHAVTRFSAAEPKGDKEASTVIICDPVCNGRLHDLWKDGLGSGNGIADVLRQAAEIPAAPADAAADTDVDDWVRDSLEVAKTVVYAPPIGDGDGPYRLTEAYKAKAGKACRDLAALAGARLAHFLNAAFP